LAGETEILGENLPQRYFVHHKSHLTRPGLEPGETYMIIGIITRHLSCEQVSIPLNEINYTIHDVELG
jgi:hypothetical protein